jgi:competence protein ComEC
VKTKKYLISLILGILIFSLLQFITLTPSDKLLVYFLNVGQGDAALIKYPTGERLLIDTGKDSALFRELDKILPWYDKRIDYVLLTHGDLDHVGAMLDLFDRYQIKKLFVSEFFGQIDIEKEIQNRAKSENTQIHVLKQGDILTVGTTISNQFQILHPDSNCMNQFNNENDCSLVGLLQYGEFKALFTGDIGKEVEQKLVPQIPQAIDILKVAHHGSKNSTDEHFIQKIKPQHAVISYGENKYGHPTQEVISILENAKVQIWKTKEVATIVATSFGTSIEVKKLFDQTSFFQSSVCTILLYSFETSC